jgi:serine/threonine protein kinase/Tol biopolymer transport system component
VRKRTEPRVYPGAVYNSRVLTPQSVLGPYQIVGPLGEGGMGVVYRARDTRLGRDVAIKVLTHVAFNDRDRLLRFEQEARATGMLNHPNLLTIYDIGRDDDDNPYLVSELLEGETLRARLERGPLAARRAVDAALQMAQGLAAAHEKGIVHRDLKPDNVFLTRDGRLKILDFGIAKLTSKNPDGPVFEMAATEPGMVMGTVGYMSPEQIRGEPVDYRSDLFSLGAIFFEMMSGTRAFKRDSSIETLSAILREDPPELVDLVPNCPPALERLIRRCLEKDRELRYQSARDLAFNLETLASMSGATTLPPIARGVGTLTTAASGRVASTAANTAVLAATPSTSAQPARTATTARPPARPRRISPLLVGLLFVVSVAGAAYAGWMLARRGSETVAEPQFNRLTFRRGEVRAARFSPDGETIVYSAAWDGDRTETFIATRRATEARPLGVAESEVLAISKTSELAILLRRDRVTNLGTLASVPLAGGVPRDIAENVLQADWSPDGANLAIIRRQGDKTRIEYPIGTVRYETPHYVRDIRISPDGKRLAILEPSRGEYDLAIIDQGTPVTIARGWARGATGLAWSPDGRELWVSGTSSSAPPALYAVNVADGVMRLVTRLTGSIRMFDIAPNGEALLSNGTWRAALLWSTGGTAAVPQPAPSPATTTAAASSPASAPATTSFGAEREASWLDWSILADLSPDGKTILFSETREGGGARSAVYLRRLDALAPIRLAEGIGDALSPDGKWALVHQGSKLVIVPTGSGMARELKIDGAFDPGAAWMFDSRRVVVAGVVGKGGYRLYAIDTLDETARPISPEGIWSAGTRAFALAPNGRLVAGMTQDQRIAIYSLTGEPPVSMPGVEPGEIPVQWSADGNSLFVYRPTTVPARVFRVTIATGARELWREFLPGDRAGVYKISPVLITPDGTQYAYNAVRALSDLYVVEGVK